MRFQCNETLVKAIALQVHELQLFKEKNRANIAKLNVSFWLVPNFGCIVLKIQEGQLLLVIFLVYMCVLTVD